MSKDYMRYDLLAQDALRGVVRMALERVREEGLPGSHYFYISFITSFPGVEISDDLKAQHPHEMMIILQHQFWDLEVGDEGFTVTLSFKKVPERLVIPYKAVKGFIDPSVQFGLQFHVEGEGDLMPGETAQEGEEASELAATPIPFPDAEAQGESVKAFTRPDRDETRADGADEKDDEAPDDDTDPPPKGDVVELDAFRKK